MQKLFTIFFILTTLIFPATVSAQCMHCGEGVETGPACTTFLVSNLPPSTTNPPVVKPKVPGCPADQQATINNVTDSACKCVAVGAAGATGPIGPVNDKACTCPSGTSFDNATLTCVGGGTSTPPRCSGGRCTVGDPDCTVAKGLRCDPGSGNFDKDGVSQGIYTAIGCIPAEPKALIESLLRFGVLASGGVAFLIMLLAAIQMITAEGNPQTIKTSQEKFYSAIIGLLLVIFSVLLMQVIGVDLLGLQGFGR